eukprot:420369_1
MSNISNKTKPKTICSRLQIVNLHTPMKKTVNRYIISNNNHKNNSHQRHLRTPDASTALIYLQETAIGLKYDLSNVKNIEYDNVKGENADHNNVALELINALKDSAKSTTTTTTSSTTTTTVSNTNSNDYESSEHKSASPSVSNTNNTSSSVVRGVFQQDILNQLKLIRQDTQSIRQNTQPSHDLSIHNCQDIQWDKDRKTFKKNKKKMQNTLLELQNELKQNENWHEKYNKLQIQFHNVKKSKEHWKEKCQESHIITSNNYGNRMMMMRINNLMSHIPCNVEYQIKLVMELIKGYPALGHSLKLYYQPIFAQMVNKVMKDESVDVILMISEMVALRVIGGSNFKYDTSRILKQYTRDAETRELVQKLLGDTGVMKNKEPTSKKLRECHTFYVQTSHPYLEMKVVQCDDLRGVKPVVSFKEYIHGILAHYCHDKGAKQIVTFSEHKYIEKCANATVENPMDFRHIIKLYLSKDGLPMRGFRERVASALAVRHNGYAKPVYQESSFLHTYAGTLTNDASVFIEKVDVTDEELDEIEANGLVISICDGKGRVIVDAKFYKIGDWSQHKNDTYERGPGSDQPIAYVVVYQGGAKDKKDSYYWIDDTNELKAMGLVYVTSTGHLKDTDETVPYLTFASWVIIMLFVAVIIENIKKENEKRLLNNEPVMNKKETE